MPVILASTGTLELTGNGAVVWDGPATAYVWPGYLDVYGSSASVKLTDLSGQMTGDATVDGETTAEVIYLRGVFS